MRKLIITVAAAGVAVCAGVGLWAVDRLLSRPDRIRVIQEREDLRLLGDRIQRYRIEHGRPPATLAEVTEDGVAMTQPDPRTGKRSAYEWDPQTRRLQCADPLPIRGIITRLETLSLTLPDIEVASPAPADPPPPPSPTGVPSLPPTLQLVAPPDCTIETLDARPDDIVIEAEDWTEMTYGWHIGTSPAASGGAYLHVPEGLGDYESEKKLANGVSGRTGDFYGVTQDCRRSQVVYYVDVPQTSVYTFAFRTMSHRSKCSNVLELFVNGIKQEKVGEAFSHPFVWRWYRTCRQYLRAGTNEIRLNISQDGVKVDQFVLSRYNSDVLGLVPDRKVVFRKPAGQQLKAAPGKAPVDLSISFDTLAIRSGSEPQIAVNILSNLDAPATGTLYAEMPMPDGDVRTAELPVTVPVRGTAMRVQYTMNAPRPLPRREYLLRVRLELEDGSVAERAQPFARPWDWVVLDPISSGAALGDHPEHNLPLKSSYKLGRAVHAWSRFDDSFYERYMIMDFARMHGTGTFAGPTQVITYGYTEVEAAEAGTYLLKAQGDDVLHAWVNDQPVVGITEKGPPIRTATEVSVHLNKGRNTIWFRLSQVDAQWQCGLRLRTMDDKPADVVGVPADEFTINLLESGK